MNTHRSAWAPVVTVQCDDTAHGENPWIVARFTKPPAGYRIGRNRTATGDEWLMLGAWSDVAFDESKQKLARLEDRVSPDGNRYNLECKECAQHHRRQTVPVTRDRLAPICDILTDAGVSTISLTALAARLASSTDR